MAKLIATRGLPASGKTTWAREQRDWVWRVNRDDLRAMLQTRWPHGDQDYEDMCTEVQHAAIRALLEHEADVVVDDTNLRPSTLDNLRDLAEEMGAQFEVKDFTDVPLEECIARDAARPKAQRVGERVIRRMHERYLSAEVRKAQAGEPFNHPELGPMPGYVAGECGHRVAESEWRAGFRTCERCPRAS